MSDHAALSQTQRHAVAELLRITPLTDELGRLFEKAGEELYLVGGSVRDALLGRLGHDLDFTTSAGPDRTEELLRSFSHSVWTVGKEFGTVGASKRSDGREWVVEVTTFRADAYSPESRKPVVAFGDNIAEDLVRRDFTVNAMAVDVVGKTFVDPHGGLQDLAAKVLRTPSTPQVSFSDDPLRMMRAARFAAQLGFSIEPAAFNAMTGMHERISIVSAERVRDELSRLLLADTPRPGLNLLVGSGLADVILPELPAMRLERDEHFRHKDVYEHSLTVLDQAIALEKARDCKDGRSNPDHEPDLVIRLAALLHDIGKPATRALEDGKVTFHHHDIVGAKLARKRLRALRYPKNVVQAVSQLIEQHLRFHGYGDQSWTDSAVRRYVRDAGDQLEHLHILTRSDCTTRNRRKAERLRRAYDELETRIDELSAQEELDAMRPDLNGNQIMQILGIGPGREVGMAYRHLLGLRMDEGPLGVERATAELRKWWDGRLH
ncbi:CCA tRNA nucleotidyltransferase [uncultured Propionibacterium sp.]|uniref:CCA tRNA nucleotidyltransferase n=1 Tax=uncultured Propionibacterium sp. TaxID=218066 RepID=UPI00292E8794|nr:CCA tRNA nucleotidyltransferase [uncultured Propionibacterium sp.]